MNEINLANTIVKKRREKGITQDELAEYIGVGKSSVSKWETGQSYPDITFLPQLATYFNISIDELMSYSPQMTKDDIRKLYLRLSEDYASKPFDGVFAECEAIIKKYYSCFPLLLQMSILLVNHCSLAGERALGILDLAIELCARARTESGDIALSKEAASIEALFCLHAKRPERVFELLGESASYFGPDLNTISLAHQLVGNTKKALEITQVSILQHLIYVLSETPSLLFMSIDDLPKAEEILRRSLVLAELYNVKTLDANVIVQIYFSAAQFYCTLHDKEKALSMLEKYLEVCLDFFPYSLHGDDFFDAVDVWFSEIGVIGAGPVRSEKVMKESMWLGLEANPAFSVLSDEPKYIRILEKLKNI